MPTTAVIIPCYNEAERLRKEAFESFISAHRDISFYYVNDGSTDHSLAILKNIQEQYPLQTYIIDLPINMGKGEAVRMGIKEALKKDSYCFIGFLDADLSTSLDEFFALCEFAYQKDADMVLGSRIKKLGSNIKRSFLRHLAGRIIATLIDNKFKLGCYDTQCGAKLFKTEVARFVSEEKFFTSWFFDVEILIRAKKQGYKNLIEYPLNNWFNVKGSKLNILSFPTILKEFIDLLTKYKSDVEHKKRD